jgi:hypothetical protein
MRLLLTASVAFLAIVFLAGPDTRAQIKTPKPPDTYDVQIRYRILADRNERVLQFDEMAKFFAGLGFKETETDESDLAPFDPAAERIIGTIPSKNARELLNDRRVQTILLTPVGYKLPEKPDELVRVRLEIATNRDQLALFNQVSTALGKLGFRRDLGVDTQGFKVTKGTVPAGYVTKLLRDLRQQPSGWFVPDVASELYARLPDGTPTPHLVRPFADGVPVRVIEVLGPAEAAPMTVALPPIPPDQAYLAKLTADIRRRLAEEGARDKPLRVEVVLVTAPSDLDHGWRLPLAGAGALIEGRVGSVVTVLLPQGSRAETIAAQPDVASVRLPRISSAPPAAQPKKAGPKDDKELTRISFQDPKTGKAVDPLKETGLDRLHALGATGKGIRVVILDTDFAGWDKHLEVKKDAVSQRVTFIDLSTDRNHDVLPDPMPGDLGHGTKSALAIRAAAPAAELLLVRIPPDAPYHVVNVARYVRGDLFRTEGIISRRLEIEADLDALQQRQRDALAEYRKAFDDFSDEEDARKRRIAAQEALRKLGQEEQAITVRLGRVEALELALGRLAGAQIVLSQLYWNTGFPLDGASTISRFLDEWLTRPKGSYTRHLTKPNPLQPPLWFQPAGDTRGQTWTGLFRDIDGNGVMEFESADEPLRPGRWSRELNFLSTHSDGKEVLDLTAGAKVRISIQWREPHDPMLSEQDYRVAVAPLRLQLVKQRDPSGEKYASDELDLIAESEGLPSRLHIEPEFAVYEHSLELSLPADGRYAIRVEGTVPPMARPAAVPTLRDQELAWELRPRIFVESADGQTKFMLADFTSTDGGVAVPGDARSVFAVGALGTNNKSRPTVAGGAGPVTLLRTKPDLLAPSTNGSDMAAAYAAGFAATVQSAGLPPASFPQGLKIEPGGVIAVPESWLRR